MGNLSRDFSLEEFRCPCCGKAEIQEDLILALQALRDLTGPIRILSGWRCEAHNGAAGGASDSYHCLGKAADIRISRFGIGEMYEAALQIPAFRQGGIGLYDGGFVHVDTRGSRARWVRVNGHYVGLENALFRA